MSSNSSFHVALLTPKYVLCLSSQVLYLPLFIEKEKEKKSKKKRKFLKQLGVWYKIEKFPICLKPMSIRPKWWLATAYTWWLRSLFRICKKVAFLEVVDGLVFIIPILYLNIFKHPISLHPHYLQLDVASALPFFTCGFLVVIDMPI